MDILKIITDNSKNFQTEAHKILSQHETSKVSRIITLDETRKKLLSLSVRQEELIQESLECIERGLYRASIVLAWAAFIDFIEEKLQSDNLVRVKKERPKWGHFKNIDELKENIPEHQILEVCHDAGLLSKGEFKSLAGLLSKRNECAHPNNYKPEMNESLGYISELLNRILVIKQKPL